jgi:hypothetical protein
MLFLAFTLAPLIAVFASGRLLRLTVGEARVRQPVAAEPKL